MKNDYREDGSQSWAGYKDEADDKPVTLVSFAEKLFAGQGLTLQPWQRSVLEFIEKNPNTRHIFRLAEKGFAKGGGEIGKSKRGPLVGEQGPEVIIPGGKRPNEWSRRTIGDSAYVKVEESKDGEEWKARGLHATPEPFLADNGKYFVPKATAPNSRGQSATVVIHDEISGDCHAAEPEQFKVGDVVQIIGNRGARDVTVVSLESNGLIRVSWFESTGAGPFRGNFYSHNLAPVESSAPQAQPFKAGDVVFCKVKKRLVTIDSVLGPDRFRISYKRSGRFGLGVGFRYSHELERPE